MFLWFFIYIIFLTFNDLFSDVFISIVMVFSFIWFSDLHFYYFMIVFSHISLFLFFSSDFVLILIFMIFYFFFLGIFIFRVFYWFFGQLYNYLWLMYFYVALVFWRYSLILFSHLISQYIGNRRDGHMYRLDIWNSLYGLTESLV